MADINSTFEASFDILKKKNLADKLESRDFISSSDSEAALLKDSLKAKREEIKSGKLTAEQLLSLKRNIRELKMILELKESANKLVTAQAEEKQGLTKENIDGLSTTKKLARTEMISLIDDITSQSKEDRAKLDEYTGKVEKQDEKKDRAEFISIFSGILTPAEENALKNTWANPRKLIKALVESDWKIDGKTEDGWKKFGYTSFGKLFWVGDKEELALVNRVKDWFEKNKELFTYVSDQLAKGRTFSSIRTEREWVKKLSNTQDVSAYLSGELYKPESKTAFGGQNDVLFQRIDSKVLYTLLNQELTKNNPQVVFAISKLMRLGGLQYAESVTNLDTLKLLLVNHPAARSAFNRGVAMIASQTSDLQNYIRSGGDVSEVVTNSDILKEIDACYEKIGITKERLSGKFDDEVIKKVEDSASKAAEPLKTQLQNLSKYLKDNKDTIVHQWKLRQAGIFIDSGKVGAGVTWTKDNFGFDLGLFYANGNIIPGIGAHVSGSKKLSETVTVDGTVGTALIFPYVIGTISKQYNLDDIKKAWLGEPKDASKFVASGALGTLWGYGGAWGIGEAWVSHSALEWVQQKVGLLKTQLANKTKNLPNVASIDQVVFDGMPDTDQKAIKQVLAWTLAEFGYDKADSKVKEQMLSDVLDGLTRLIEQDLISKSAAKGFKFSDFRIGALLMGTVIVPMPIWVRLGWTRVRTEYTTDEASGNREKLRQKLDITKINENLSKEDFIKKLAPTLPVGVSVVPNSSEQLEITGWKQAGFNVELRGTEAEIKELSAQLKTEGDKLTIGKIAYVNVEEELGKSGRITRLVLRNSPANNQEKISVKEIADTLSGNTPGAMFGSTETPASATKTKKYESNISIFAEKLGKDFDTREYILSHRTYSPRVNGAYRTFEKALESADLTATKTAALTLLDACMVGAPKSVKDVLQEAKNSLSNADPKSAITVDQLSMLKSYFAGSRGSLYRELYLTNKQEFERRLKKIDPQYAAYLRNEMKRDNAKFALEEDKVAHTNRTKGVEGALNAEMLRSSEKLEGAQKEKFKDPEYRWGVVDAFKSLREEALRTHESGKQGWKTSEPKRNIFALEANYKLGLWGKGSSLEKGFALMPPGAIRIANDWTADVRDSGMQELMVAMMSSKKTHFENMAKSIAKIFELGTFSTEDLKTLLLTGTTKIDNKTVTLNRKFIFFMSGFCFNESLGIQIEGLEVAEPGKPTKKMRSPSFSATGAIEQQNLSAYEQSLTGAVTKKIVTGDVPSEWKAGTNLGGGTGGGTGGGGTGPGGSSGGGH